MFLSCLVLCFGLANAQEPNVESQPSGQFSILADGQPAPFAGVILDINATATVLTFDEYLKQRCQANTDFQLETQAADYDLQLEKLKIRLDSLEEQRVAENQQKENEIAALNEQLKKSSPGKKVIWGIVGATIGASTTVAIINLTNN